METDNVTFLPYLSQTAFKPCHYVLLQSFYLFWTTSHVWCATCFTWYLLSFFIWFLNVKNTISDISKHLSFQLYWRCNSSRWVCWLDKLVWAKMKYVHCYQSFLCQVQSQKKAVHLLSGLAYPVDLKTVKSYILIIITLIHQRLSHRITRQFLLLKWFFCQFCNSVILFIFFC